MVTLTTVGTEIVVDTSGGSTLFGRNVMITQKGIKGWHGGGVAVRRKAQERLWAHGDFSTTGKRGPRLVTLEGVAWGDSRRDAANMVDDFNAILADGREGKLTVIDADLGTRWSNCFLYGDPEVEWDGDEVLTFAFEVICTDPRKYGEPRTYRTGVAFGGDGLKYPLFGGAPYSLQRTNLAVNPRVNSATGWAVRSYGTGGAGSAAFNAGAGYVGNGFYRMTYTTASTAGPLGPWYTQAAVGVAGDVYSARIAVRASVAKTWYCRVAFYNGATLVNEVIGAVSVGTSANVWGTPEALAAAATGAFTQIRVTATPSNAVFAAGATIDAGAVHLEKAGTLGSMFSGGTADTQTEVYEWAGTPDASESTYSMLGGKAGILDFGETGDLGTITFTNEGTADTYPRFRVKGYTPWFVITEVETGRQLKYIGEVPMFQNLYLNAFNGSVYLDTPEAVRLQNLARAEWPVIPGRGPGVPLTRRTYRFESPEGTEAELFMEVSSAWF